MHLIICQSCRCLWGWWIDCSVAGSLEGARGLWLRGWLSSCYRHVFVFALLLFCFLTASTAHVSVDKVSHSVPDRKTVDHRSPGPSWKPAHSPLATLHAPLSVLHSALATRLSHGTLRGWSILPLARHLQICALTHSHSECTHELLTQKTIQTMRLIWSECTTKP